MTVFKIPYVWKLIKDTTKQQLGVRTNQIENLLKTQNLDARKALHVNISGMQLKQG